MLAGTKIFQKHNFVSTISANQSLMALDEVGQMQQNEELQSLREVRCSRSNHSRGSKNGTKTNKADCKNPYVQKLKKGRTKKLELDMSVCQQPTSSIIKIADGLEDEEKPFLLLAEPHESPLKLTEQHSQQPADVLSYTLPSGTNFLKPQILGTSMA